MINPKNLTLPRVLCHDCNTELNHNDIKEFLIINCSCRNADILWGIDHVSIKISINNYLIFLNYFDNKQECTIYIRGDYDDICFLNYIPFSDISNQTTTAFELETLLTFV